METNIILVVILAISVFGKADSVSIAMSILLVIRILHIDSTIFPVLNKYGVFWALVLLIAAIMLPIANGSITLGSIKTNFTSVVGIIALLLSFLTTYLSGLGLKYLTVDSHAGVMPSLILGAVAAAALLGGFQLDR